MKIKMWKVFYLVALRRARASAVCHAANFVLRLSCRGQIQGNTNGEGDDCQLKNPREEREEQNGSDRTDSSAKQGRVMGTDSSSRTHLLPSLTKAMAKRILFRKKMRISRTIARAIEEMINKTSQVSFLVAYDSKTFLSSVSSRIGSFFSSMYLRVVK
jgi:hypothetical protein